MSYSYVPTTQDLKLLQQKIKNVSVKVNILNKKFVTIDSIQGTILNDSYSINVDSDIRRTISLGLQITKDYDILDIYKKIWIDRLFEIYFGVEDIFTNEVIWYKFGIFTFDNVTYTIDASTYTLQLSCIDLVALLNGNLSGQLTGTGLVIPASTDDTPNKVRDVMISTITQLGGFTKYNIEDMDTTIPYDLEFGVGATVWQVITTLRDLLSGWETFFDVDGTFVCQPIPTTEDAPIYINNEIFNDLVITENIADNVASIKNVTKVFGSTLETDFYTEEMSSSALEDSTTYKVTSQNPDNFTFDNALGIRTSFLVPLQSTSNVNNLSMFIENKTNTYPLLTPNITSIVDNQYYYIDYHYDYLNSTWKRENWFEISPKHYVSSNITYEIKNSSSDDSQELYYYVTTYNNFDYNEIENNNYKNTLILRNLPIGNGNINNVFIQINNGTPIKLSILNTNKNNSSTYNVSSYALVQNNTYKIYRKDMSAIGVDMIKDNIEIFNQNNIILNKALFDKKTIYTTTIDSLTLEEYTRIGIKIPTTSTSQSVISLNGIIYPTTDINNEDIENGALVADKSYVFSYSKTENKFVLWGQWQIMGMAKEVSSEPTMTEKEQDKINNSCDNIIYIVNPDSPYTVEKAGTLLQVLSNNDYRNIYADELAIERAEYENWKATRLNDTVTITNIMIPWLRGNEKVEYTRKKVDITDAYIIKQISGSVTTWTQTIVMSKFYPLYPFIVS